MSNFIKGFAMGFSLIVAIGAQNAFVLKQGIKKQFVLPIVLICAVSDALLIFLGVLGLGSLVGTFPYFTQIAAAAGFVFLLWYGFRSFQRAAQPGSLTVDARGGNNQTLKTALLTCLAFTYLNPHVYLDTVVLVGSIAAQYASEKERYLFGIGAASASFIWFFSLGYGARILAPLFAKPIAWRILDTLIGIIMWSIAFSLVGYIV